MNSRPRGSAPAVTLMVMRKPSQRDMAILGAAGTIRMDLAPITPAATSPKPSERNCRVHLLRPY